MIRRTISLLGLVTLLMGADGANQLSVTLPTCEPNTYLVYHGGKVVCAPTLPDCHGDLLHADPGGDLSALSCIAQHDDALSNADRQRVLDLQAQFKSILGQLDELGVGQPLLANFVGITAATTIGRIEYPGTPVGLPAANARCAAEFGLGTHMCSAREMLGEVISGKLNPGVDLPPAWLYMPTFNTPAPEAEQRLSGLGDNCGGYTDGTLDHGWTGMAVEWTFADTGHRTLHFDSGPVASCDQPLPIACCQ
jgi:hypothetical protein